MMILDIDDVLDIRDGDESGVFDCFTSPIIENKLLISWCILVSGG